MSGTDTRSLGVFTQSQARYPLGRTQAERNRSTLPFPIRDVNPKAAVRRRSWIPLAVLMSLVYVALLSPSLKQRCPLNLDWWCWASDTASRGGKVRVGHNPIPEGFRLIARNGLKATLQQLHAFGHLTRFT
jgi:hypothetical protein